MPLDPITDPRDLLTKPSDAITAMIDGLREAQEDPYCAIDMLSFGEQSDHGVCYGCAATFAVFHLARQGKVDFIAPATQRYQHLGLRWKDFENMIDSLRKGSWRTLLWYYGIFYEQAESLTPAIRLETLDTDTWPQHIRWYELYRDQLKKAGY